MRGLVPLMQQVENKRILDIGCAEGLIAIECLKRGAKCVRGIEIVPGHVEVARRIALEQSVGFAAAFTVADANTYQPTDEFDIVLLLAILHKLRDPSAAADRFARVCRDLCVIRLPPATAPTVVDSRSGDIPHDINAVMERNDFVLESVRKGHFEEWTGYYRRVNGHA